ncbi:MAG: glycosyltransferase, partial [Thermoleophilaceae bacterium]
VVGASLSGAQTHVLELVAALARTGADRLRVLPGAELGGEPREVLESLNGVKILSGTLPDAPPVDIVHRPSQVAVPYDLELLARLGDRVVVTQQDLIAYRNPAYHATLSWWRQYRRATRLAMAMADAVVFSSRHTLEDALADDLVDERRAHVLPIAAEHTLVALAGPPQRPEGLPSAVSHAGYLLCLGNDFKHKNQVFALHLLDALRRRGWTGSLVFAGGKVEHGSSRPDEDALIAERPGLAEAVVRLGPVSEPEKAWLYKHAAAVAYPTLYEGFGLVPFEAGRAGVPCLFAPQASLAEVLPAEAALLVQWDEEVSAERVLPLLTASPERTAHVELLRRAAGALSSWDDHAAALIEVYERALSLPEREARAVAHEAVEREVELARWRELEEEFGPDGFSLIRPGGYLPQDIQRALLAVATRPRMRAPLFALLRAFYRAGHEARGRR